MRLKKLKKEIQDSAENDTSLVWVSLGIAALYGLAGSLFFFTKRIKRPTGKKIDIEIRYNTEKNADATLLAQNLVKIIRIVLSPLEPKINKENARLIFVYNEDSWEMRVSNGSEKLRQSVRSLLESKEW
jgi:hypothetical protein